MTSAIDFGLGRGRRPAAHAPVGGTPAMRGAAIDASPVPVEDPRDEALRVEHERNAILAHDLATVRQQVAAQAEYVAEVQAWAAAVQERATTASSAPTPTPRTHTPSGYPVGAPAGRRRRPSGSGIAAMRITLTCDERVVLEQLAAADGSAASCVVGRLVLAEQRRRVEPVVRSLDIGAVVAAAIAAATAAATISAVP